MYEPYEFSMRYPEIPTPDAHWSTVWLEAFRAEVRVFMSPGSLKNYVGLGEALKVLRLCELTEHSLRRDGKLFRDVVLEHDSSKRKWITLASDA